jgi:outer membrane protein assembly factor BamE (lipoprotein component of BamABCDE complex)
MRYLIGLIASVLLTGCQTASGPQVSTNDVTQIQVGRTDKATIEGLLGKPTYRNVVRSGEETWIYSGYQTGGDAGGRAVAGVGAFTVGTVVGGFVPIVGPLVAAGATAAAMNGAQSTSQTKTLTVIFKKNVVASCRLTTSTTTITTSGFGGVAPSSQSEELPCSEVRVAAGVSPGDSAQAPVVARD